MSETSEIVVNNYGLGLGCMSSCTGRDHSPIVADLYAGDNAGRIPWNIRLPWAYKGFASPSLIRSLLPPLVTVRRRLMKLPDRPLMCCSPDCCIQVLRRYRSNRVLERGVVRFQRRRKIRGDGAQGSLDKSGQIDGDISCDAKAVRHKTFRDTSNDAEVRDS